MEMQSDFPFLEGKVSACIVGGPRKLALGLVWMLPTTGGSGSCDSVLFPLAISQVHNFQRVINIGMDILNTRLDVANDGRVLFLRTQSTCPHHLWFILN